MNSPRGMRACTSITIAAIIAAVVLVSCASAAEQAMPQAAHHLPVVNFAGAPVLNSSDAIKLGASIDMTGRSDIFGRIRDFNAAAPMVELQDGVYATWNYKIAWSPSGVSYPAELGTVKIGPTPRALGIWVYPKPNVSIPAQVPCDVIDIHDLENIRSSRFEYIAACRIDSAKGRTELVLFNADGQYRTLGFHPLRVAQISTSPAHHGSGGRLYMMTVIGPDQKIYLQWYDWTPA